MYILYKVTLCLNESRTDPHERQSKSRVRLLFRPDHIETPTDFLVLLGESGELPCERVVALFDGVAYFFICHIAMEFGK